MGRLLKGLTAWGLYGGLAILSLVPPAYAADPDAAKPEASEVPSADAQKPAGKPEEPAQGEADKPAAPESGTPEKPGEAAAPKTEGDKEASAAAAEKGGLKMQELLAQGFQIRTTVLIPAEVVTRQTGKLTADAFVVTMQKENAIAVCYYTLKSYVRLRLAGLATCTMFP
jgi:hypothetical protein